MTEILVSFYYPSGKFRQACRIDVGDCSLVDEKKFKRKIVDGQTCMGIGWQGYYYVHTDLTKVRTDWYRGFHSKIFKPVDFEQIGKGGQKPWKHLKNVKKADGEVQIRMAKEEGKIEMKMGEPRPDGYHVAEMQMKGYKGLYGRNL